MAFCKNCAVLGSPPRGRGKGSPLDRKRETPWITPAWAGKSWRSRCREPPRQDHPRMGGEKSPSLVLIGRNWDHPRAGGEKASTTTLITGQQPSPPRGRGKGGYGWLMLTLTGITPAWAGKRQLWRLSMSRHWDHPRVGGEKKKHTKAADVCPGSPPRGRGKVSLFAYINVCEGITPAWAGKR